MKYVRKVVEVIKGRKQIKKVKDKLIDIVTEIEQALKQVRIDRR